MRVHLCYSQKCHGSSFTLTTAPFIHPPTHPYICRPLSSTQIDVNAPFSVAFEAAGMKWARTLVALGSLAGILTSLLGALIGQSRIYVILGRQHLLPPWLVGGMVVVGRGDSGSTCCRRVWWAEGGGADRRGMRGFLSSSFPLSSPPHSSLPHSPSSLSSSHSLLPHPSSPPLQAHVSDSGTPVNATKLTMLTAGLLALLFDIQVLAEMVSIGTLVVFAMVNSGIIFR
jgi:amino acid transporter